MSSEERDKLATLLNYWIKHNREHSQEFREWAAKVKGFGDNEISEEMLKAAREMDKAGEWLSQALTRLGKKES